MTKQKDTIVQEIEKNMKKNIPIESDMLKPAESEIFTTIRKTISYFEAYIFPIKVEIIKQKYLNAVDRTYQMKKMGMKNRSNRIYPLIASVHDTFVSNLFEVETTPRIIARHEADQESAPTVQGWYDWARDISGHSRSMLPIKSEACLIGTSYGRVGFKSTNSDVTWIKKDGTRGHSALEEMKPTVKHVSFFQLFYDPFCDSFDECPWKAYRYINNLKDTTKKYSFLFDNDNKWIDAYRGKIKGGSPVSQYDFTRIYSSKNYEKEILMLKSEGAYDNWVSKKLFTVAYADQDLVEVIEYRQDDQLILFINGVSVYEGDSPYPFNGDPFSIIIHEEVPGQIQGIGIGDKLMNHQINANTLFSGLEDAMRMQLYPMYKASPGALVDAAGKAIKTLTYEPERVVEDRSKIGNGGIEIIKWIDFNTVNTLMARLGALVSESFEIIGLNSYVQGGNGKMERSAQGVTQKATIIRTRLLGMIESLNEFNSRVFNQWLLIALVMFPETFNYRIIDEEGQPVWKDIKLEDVINKFNIVAESESMRAATKELKASQAMDAMSKLVPMNIDPLTGLPIYHLEEFIQDFMSKFDFKTPTKFTEEELIEKIKMKQRVDQAANPTPAPVAPSTDVLPAPVAPSPDALPMDMMPIQTPPPAPELPQDFNMISQGTL